MAGCTFSCLAVLVPYYGPIRVTLEGWYIQCPTCVSLCHLSKVSRLNLQSSPLYRHVSPGRVVTYLDDVALAGNEDSWSRYLKYQIGDDTSRGWCINKSTFAGKHSKPDVSLADNIALPESPCTSEPGKVTFSTFGNVGDRCLDPNPILYTPSIQCPCPNPDQICVRPLESERIMRIRLDDGASENGEVVLWQGDRSLVLRDIQVGREGARFFGPVVRWGTIFIE